MLMQTGYITGQPPSILDAGLWSYLFATLSIFSHQNYADIAGFVKQTAQKSFFRKLPSILGVNKDELTISKYLTKDAFLNTASVV